MNFVLHTRQTRGDEKPFVITCSLAVHRNKFLSTINKITPENPPETLSEDDSLKVKNIEDVTSAIESFITYVLKPRLQALHSVPNKLHEVPIVIGWRENLFSNQPITEIYNHLDRIIRNLFQDTPGFKPIIRFSSVSGPPVKAQKYPLSKMGENLYELFREVGGVVEEKREEALDKLRKLVYKIGNDFGKNMIDQLGATRIVPTNSSDVAEGNRFSSFVYDGLGCLTKSFLRVWNLRKDFSQGVKSALGLRSDHVLCIKSLGEREDRPLTNVAGAIALQLFIDKGYMKIDEVPDPYG